MQTKSLLLFVFVGYIYYDGVIIPEYHIPSQDVVVHVMKKRKKLRIKTNMMAGRQAGKKNETLLKIFIVIINPTQLTKSFSGFVISSTPSTFFHFLKTTLQSIDLICIQIKFAGSANLLQDYFHNRIGQSFISDFIPKYN